MLSFVKKAKPYHIIYVCMYIFITMTGVNDQTIGSSSSKSIGLSFVEQENYFGKTQVDLEVKESLSLLR